jgi:uncharacterized YccA/Bax inhibitor family protein
MSTLFQSSNPAFSEAVLGDWGASRDLDRSMTVQGTATKTLILLGILTATASLTWTQVQDGRLNIGLLIGAAVAGLVLFLITAFKKEWAPVTAPLYAGCQGVVLGAISSLVNQQYPGIAIQAVVLTVATAFVMMFLYATRMIRVTERLRSAVIAGTAALALFYLVVFALGLFGVRGPLQMMYSSGPLGIGISLLAVGLAAFNLLLDFDFIEQGERSGAPKLMEWYGAFGLTVTLIWLYLEILRLLRKLRER